MASNTERTVTARLRFETDKSSLAKATADLDLLEKEFASIPAAVKRANADVSTLTRSLLDQQRAAVKAGNANSAMSADVQRTNTNLRGLIDGMKESAQTATVLARNVDKAASSVNNLGAQSGRAQVDLANDQFDMVSRRVGLAGDVQSNLGALRGLSGAAGLGGAAGGLDVAGEIIVLAEELPRLKTALAGMPATIQAAVQALGTGGVGLIGGIALLTVAFKLLADQVERERKEIQGALGDYREVSDLIRAGSREQIEAELETNRVALASARAQQEALQRLVTQADADLGTKPILYRLRAEISQLGELRDQLGDVNEEVRSAEASLSQLEGALADGAVQARLAAEAEAELAAERQKYYDAFVNAEVSALRDARDIQDTGALDERVQSLRDERQLYLDIIATRNLSAEAEQQYLDKIRDIDAAVQVFTRQGLVAEIEAREREAQAIERATKVRQRNIDQQDALAKAQDDAAKATESFNASLEKIATDARTKLAAAANDRTKALVDAEQAAQKSRADAISARETSITEVTRKAGLDREKQTREHLKRLAEINRRADLDLLTAIEDRDSVAQERITRARDEAVRTENDNYAEQQREVDSSLREQTRTISMRYAEQTATINARLNEQTAAVNARYTEQVQQIYAAANVARQTEINSYQQRLSTLAQFVQREVGISAQGAAALLGVQQQYWQAALSMASSALQSIRATQAQGTQFRGNTQILSRSGQALARGTGRGMVSFDTGGYITRTGAAMVHQGEIIMNPSRGQYPVNFAPTVNMGQGGADQIRSVLMAEVDRFVGQLERGMM